MGIILDPSELRAYTRIPTGPGYSTVLADLDYETFSEAGFWFDYDKGTWRPVGRAPQGGLKAVGSVVYAQHPTTEVISAAYNLKLGDGEQLWLPDLSPPLDLHDHLKGGELLEAWNIPFEYYIWNYVCVRKYGWPRLELDRLRCAMAKSRAFAYPGKLEKAAEVTGAVHQKIKEGTRLIKKFCRPRNPTKKDPRVRILPQDDPVDGPAFYRYNLGDIKAESAVSAVVPDLPPAELDFWQATLKMNVRGVGIDIESVEACIVILEQAYDKYNAELQGITDNAVGAASELAKLTAWLAGRGIHLPAMEDDDLKKALKRKPLAPDIKRALEIRRMIGSAGVKKLYSMRRRCAEGNRLHDLFIYHGARTGRDTGADVQPQNLVKAGPKLRWCEDSGCGRPYGQHLRRCPFCGADEAFSHTSGWKWQAVESTLEVIKSGSLDYVESVYGNAVLAISGCIRGLFVAGEDKDLICSDYSSIEAVVTAALAGEEWRLEAFRKGEDIYLKSAGDITGISLQEYEEYKAANRENHPDRAKLGKVAELGLGFGGWIGAWYQFDKSGNYTEQQIKDNILAWREASPAIVEMWGGQVRGKPWAPESYELFGFEGAAIRAVQNPEECFESNGIGFGVKDDTLYVRLPSGRFLTYHEPRLNPSTRWDGQLELSYMGWNSNAKMGPFGWIRIQTYGGRLAENIIQATARDIMAFAAVNLERAGYPIVLRVHDELAAEVIKGFGSIEEFERIMATLPPWAVDWLGRPWPIRAAGGWLGRRFRKES